MPFGLAQIKENDMAATKAKDIAQLIEDGLRRKSADDKAVVLRAINLAHIDMAEIRDWVKLRMKRSYVMAGDDTALSDNLIGITGIKSATEVYFKTEEEDVLSIDGRPHWCYASQTGDDPSATQYFNIYDAAGAPASATVDVFYWAYPKKISSENDDILIPGPRAIAMLSILILLGFIEHKPEDAEPFRIEYKDALAELMARYPLTSRSKTPRGRHGNALAIGDIG